MGERWFEDFFEAVYVAGVKHLRALGVVVAVAVIGATARAQPTPTFTRPGSIVVAELTGSAVAVAEGKEKPLKVEERARHEVSFRTERKTVLGLEFSNGTLARMGSDSELAVEEFWQQPHSRAGKSGEWKEEPSPSRARLRLVRGDVTLTVKPLLVARGSSMSLETNAGTVRITQGVLFARVQMTDIGLGLCTLELRDGVAELERAGGATAALSAGKKLVLAVEVERGTGAVKVSDAPVEGAK